MSMQVQHPQLADQLAELVRWLRENQPDLATQGQACKDAIEMLQATIRDIADVRSAAVRALWAEGWTQREIGRAFGLSHARIDQIIKR